jgi:surface polysaccharide O-acyltransferase-like enzyme
MLCTLITWGFKVIIPIYNNLFISYLSPTIILNALFWLIIFSKFNIKKPLQNIIKIASPAAFGVYLIHEQPIFRSEFISNKFIWLCDYRWWLIPIIAIGCALAIFLICLSIEIIRINLFKLLRINKLIDMISCKVEILIQKFLDFLTKHIA